MRVLAIDPGTTESAWMMLGDGKPSCWVKEPNRIVVGVALHRSPDAIVCEMIASYGMAVGAEVFETCLIIGEIRREATRLGIPFYRLGRADVKLHHCQSPRAKDANVRQAMIDRYGDKGTKKQPGPMYGMRADCWQALAVGAAWIDGVRNAKFDAYDVAMGAKQ